MLLHPNWGKLKSFVTSRKEPEPATQAHAELSGLPTSHRPGPAWVPPAAESSVHGSRARHSRVSSPHPHRDPATGRPPPWAPSPACPVDPGKGGLLAGPREVVLAPRALLAQDQGTTCGRRSVAAPRPRSGFLEAGWTAGPFRRAGALGTLWGQARATLTGRSCPTFSVGQTGSGSQEARSQHGRQTAPGAARPSCCCCEPRTPATRGRHVASWPREVQSFLPTQEPAQPRPEPLSGIPGTAKCWKPLSRGRWLGEAEARHCEFAGDLKLWLPHEEGPSRTCQGARKGFRHSPYERVKSSLFF